MSGSRRNKNSEKEPALALRAAIGIAVALMAASWQSRPRALSPEAARVYATRLVDYGGRPFVTKAAPILRFEPRSRPHLNGIDYAFPEQTARGVTLFSRFPPFRLSDRRIHVSGPWFSDPAANLHFSRGVTSVEAMPNFRLEGSAMDVRKLPTDQKWQLMCDPLFWGYADRLANELAAANPTDERIGALRTFAREHRFVPDRAAFVELGRRVWIGERAPSDEKLLGVRYPCINIEQTGGWEHQRECFGWIYDGMAEAAEQNGAHIVPITYGQWTYSVGAVQESMRSAGTGDPEYLLPDKDFLAAPDPTIEVVNRLGGVVSMDGYMQAICGSEPFFRRNSDGSLRLLNGDPEFSDLARTTAYGQSIPLEAGEAEHCLQDIYRQAARMYLMHYRLAGQYRSSSDLRKPFLKNVRIGAWTRITNEGLQGIRENDRPLPGWLIEMLTGMYLFTADDVIVWSSDTNHPPGPLGADYTSTWKYNAYGVFENLIKAAHRYSALDSLHHGPFRWCWFHLPLVDRNLTPGERYIEKPIVFAKLRTFEGKPWIELFAAWPALDGQTADLRLWLQRGGRRTPTYRCQIRNGRSYFYDAWELPAGFAEAAGRDVWLQFRDPLGATHTWRGDWRAPVPAALKAAAKPERQP